MFRARRAVTSSSQTSPNRGSGRSLMKPTARSPAHDPLLSSERLIDCLRTDWCFSAKRRRASLHKSMDIVEFRHHRIVPRSLVDQLAQRPIDHGLVVAASGASTRSRKCSRMSSSIRMVIRVFPFGTRTIAPRFPLLKSISFPFIWLLVLFRSFAVAGRAEQSPPPTARRPTRCAEKTWGDGISAAFRATPASGNVFRP
jgi:hypothetical protein